MFEKAFTDQRPPELIRASRVRQRHKVSAKGRLVKSEAKCCEYGLMASGGNLKATEISSPVGRNGKRADGPQRATTLSTYLTHDPTSLRGRLWKGMMNSYKIRKEAKRLRGFDIIPSRCLHFLGKTRPASRISWTALTLPLADRFLPETILPKLE